MIREGNEADLDSVVRMSEEFWKHTIYDEPFCAETARHMAAACLDQGLLSILEIGGQVVGFACGVKGPLLANGDVMTGTEVAWWVDPEHRKGNNGVGLLQHIEKLAKLAGIKYWNMAYMQSSMPAVIESIYERMGYTRTEVIYTRVL